MKILVVEDEHKIAQSIKKGLEQENHLVDLAFSGDDGLEMALSEEYELIILDLMLPVLSGLEVTRKLRAKKNHTPIIILTAKGQVQDKVVGLDAGADDYLTKPFAFEELLARIRALTRRPQTSVGDILQIGQLKLDTKSYVVKRFDQNIYLSVKEFALLEYLMRHPNQILTKDQIINHVWDIEADVLPNTVEVYIGYLRNKIDKPFKDHQPLIQTVRGFGYKIGGVS